MVLKDYLVVYKITKRTKCKSVVDQKKRDQIVVTDESTTQVILLFSLVEVFNEIRNK